MSREPAEPGLLTTTTQVRLASRPQLPLRVLRRGARPERSNRSRKARVTYTVSVTSSSWAAFLAVSRSSGSIATVRRTLPFGTRVGTWTE